MKTSFSFYNKDTGRNAPLLTINGVRFYFSYNTLIAVCYGGKWGISKNRWTKTTGKHLNWIDDTRSNRLEEKAFNEEVEKAMAVAGVTELPLMAI